MNTLTTDILILGSGGAGLSAALEAAIDKDLDITIVSFSYPTRSQTSMAQGGINAVLYEDEGDSIQKHIEDTLKASKNLADPKMVTKMCQKAPKAIMWLDSIGVPFSRTKDGKIAQRRLGGTKYKRACYSQDYTGLKIIQTLFDNCLKEKNISFLNRHYLLDLIIQDNIQKGAILLDLKNMQIKYIFAKATILALGGYAGLFRGYTTNNYEQNGDAIAIAIKNNIKTSNLNYIQFHPTGLKSSSVLISESARGAGGKLINSDNKRFVDELLPRDEVSKAIAKELQMGKEVFLDITHLSKEFIEENLPQERKLAIFFEGVDPLKEPIPIKPVAHYSMGGIEVDYDLQTSVKNLFAVGECSDAKVHGKNRLGGNSLLEIVVFGKEAGENAANIAKNNDLKINEDIKKIEIDDLFTKDDPKINFYEVQKELAKVLYEKAGILKTQKSLQEALLFIQNIQDDLDKMGVIDNSKVLNNNLVDFIRFKNSLVVAKEFVKSSLKEF